MIPGLLPDDVELPDDLGCDPFDMSGAEIIGNGGMRARSPFKNAPVRIGPDGKVRS